MIRSIKMHCTIWHVSTSVTEEIAISPFGSVEAEGSSETLVSVYKTARRHVPDSRNMDHIKHCCFNYHVLSLSVLKHKVSVIICMEGKVSTQLEPERAVPITGHVRN
jgi:hypothetical protein